MYTIAFMESLMNKNMDKKYQVFVSSTFEDLKNERAKVIEILLNKNCIPVGMEYFPAADDKQMTIIKNLIDECDYYVLILGGRYGSVDPLSGKSYTQLEYEYAQEKGIPISVFFRENKDQLFHHQVEISNPEKLVAFEKEVKHNRMCRPWNNAHELAGLVSISLDYQIKNHPRSGWIKADKISSEEANRTILRLEEENKHLRTQIKFLSTSIPKGTENYMQGDDVFIIHYKLPLSPFSWPEEFKDYTIEKTWNEIFLSICTLLLKPVVEDTIKAQIEKTFLPEYADIDTNDFQTIIIQLMALKLINTDIVKSDYDGAYTYWVLTSYGRTVMTRLKAIKKRK